MKKTNEFYGLYSVYYCMFPGKRGGIERERIEMEGKEGDNGLMEGKLIPLVWMFKSEEEDKEREN